MVVLAGSGVFSFTGKNKVVAPVDVTHYKVNGEGQCLECTDGDISCFVNGTGPICQCYLDESNTEPGFYTDNCQPLRKNEPMQ